MFAQNTTAIGRAWSLCLVLTLAGTSLCAIGCGEDSASNSPPDPQTDTGPEEDATQDAAETDDAETDDATDDTPMDVVEDAAEDTAEDVTDPVVIDPDINQDGTLNILIIGTSRSIGGDPFSPNQIAAELQNILTADPSISTRVNVVAENIHKNKPVTIGLGQGGMEFTWDHSSHSLVQYYHWPEGIEARLDNLAGRGDVDWDQVVIGADPHIVATLPGYHALGANMVAEKVAEGGAQPHLLMVWPKDDAAIDHFAEHTHRTSDRARVSLPTIAAGRAWEALPANKKDTAAEHPTPNGAYLTAAVIYAHLFDKSAATSDYDYDDEIAAVARAALLDEANTVHTTGQRTFESPFKAAGIADRVLSFNQTGSSSERGILDGLRWVLNKARVELRNGGTPPIHFNYGRANTNFEPNKRYQVDPERFDFSLGFPMQDNGNHGDTSMLYGLDRRLSGAENGTDLGVALHMIRQEELPNARAVPIRTLYALLKEAIPTQSAFRDAWHMHRNLDKAAGAFMYTLLTGHCALDDEPEDVESEAWRQWMAHKIGYETAWTTMHLSGVAPCFKVLPDAVDSVSVTTTQSAGLSISFANTPPTANVTVTLSTNNDGAIATEPSVLVFTPENHRIPQTVTMTGLAGEPSEDTVVITARTESSDAAFDGIEDRWEYAVIRE